MAAKKKATKTKKRGPDIQMKLEAMQTCLQALRGTKATATKFALIYWGDEDDTVGLEKVGLCSPAEMFGVLECIKFAILSNLKGKHDVSFS